MPTLNVIEHWIDIANKLSKLDLEIVQLRSYGLTYRQIAPLVNLHYSTVYRHMGKIRELLGFLLG